MSRCIAFGAVNLDILMIVDAPPALDGAVTARRTEMAAGGHAANFATVAARLGLDAAVHGSVGNDALAEFVLSTLQSRQVDISGITRVDALTGVAVASVLAESGERSLYLARGANELCELPQERTWAGADYAAIFDPPEAVLRELLRAPRAPMLFSPGSAVFAYDVLADTPLPQACEAIVVNGPEAAHLTGQATPERSAALLAQRCGVPAIVTAGDAGCWISSEGETSHEPAFVVTDVVDSTGAGDAFVAGLCSARCNGSSLREAAVVGAAVAALILRGLGAAASAPTSDEVQRLMASGARSVRR